MKKIFKQTRGRWSALHIGLLMSLGGLPSDASAQNIGTQDEINEILVRNQISTEFQYADIPSWSIKPKGVFEYFIFDYSKSAFEPKDPIFLSKIEFKKR